MLKRFDAKTYIAEQAEAKAHEANTLKAASQLPPTDVPFSKEERESTAIHAEILALEARILAGMRRTGAGSDLRSALSVTRYVERTVRNIERRKNR